MTQRINKFNTINDLVRQFEEFQKPGNEFEKWKKAKDAALNQLETLEQQASLLDNKDILKWILLQREKIQEQIQKFTIEMEVVEMVMDQKFRNTPTGKEHLKKLLK